ncbi:MAG TPA: beta-galactosidase [Acidimicrobiia bacterium]|nr:beta-galactosidase [Acidimicrobiia bacterium]
MRSRGRAGVGLAVLLCTGVLGACGPNLSPSRYGVNAHYEYAKTAPMMRAAGFKWVRLNAEWDWLNPNPGEVHPEFLDPIVNAWVKQGFSVLIVLTEEVPKWAYDPTETASHAGTDNCQGIEQGTRRPASPDDFQGFANVMAQHFKDRVAAWEVYNEPDWPCRWPGDAVDFKRLIFAPGFDGIRAAQPDAIVLGPGLTHASGLQSWYTYPVGTSHYLVRPVNAVAFHTYGSVTTDKSNMDTGSKFVACTTDGYCVHKYWLTEFGFDESYRTSSAPQIEAYCEGQSNCERIFYYDAIQSGGDMHSWGLLDETGQPRAKYGVLQNYLLQREPALPPFKVPACSAPANSAYMVPGECLKTGQALRSPNGQYTLVLQTDGNLVLYGPSGAMWSTVTYGLTATEVAFDGGNLVLYGPNGWLWSSNTAFAVNLVMQDDGVLAMYSTSEPVWARGTYSFG